MIVSGQEAVCKEEKHKNELALYLRAINIDLGRRYSKYFCLYLGTRKLRPFKKLKSSRNVNRAVISFAKYLRTGTKTAKNIPITVLIQLNDSSSTFSSSEIS